MNGDGFGIGDGSVSSITPLPCRAARRPPPRPRRPRPRSLSQKGHCEQALEPRLCLSCLQGTSSYRRAQEQEEIQRPYSAVHNFPPAATRTAQAASLHTRPDSRCPSGNTRAVLARKDLNSNRAPPLTECTIYRNSPRSARLQVNTRGTPSATIDAYLESGSRGRGMLRGARVVVT